MSQPTILKLKVSKTGHASITFRNLYMLCDSYPGDSWEIDEIEQGQIVG